MKALALVEARDHVCCRYRVRAFERALESSGWSLTIEPLAPGLLRRLHQLGGSSRFDSVLLQRKLLPGWQLRELRRRARHLVFDFDDAVLHRDSNDPRGPINRRRAQRFQRTVQVADVVIAGNTFLAQCALDAGAHPDRVRVIPTCITATPDFPNLTNHGTPGLDLVWIGSGGTLAGLDRQRSTWERIGREVPGVRLRMVCDRFLKFDALEILGIRWSEATEAAEIAAADVGISWIPDDLWSRGKCGLKVLQYQAAGLPVVANPVGVHPEMIRDGIDGFLVSTPDEWVDAVRKLASDPDLRLKMGRVARASVTAGYSVESWSPAFVSAIAGVRPISHGENRGGAIRRPLSLISREHRRGGELLPPSQQTLAS